MPIHLKGLLIAVIGVLVLSPDTLLIRLADMNQWALLVYRGFLMALGMIILSKVFDKAPLKQQFLTIGRTGILASFTFATSTIAFVNAIIYTTITHTLVIVATAPLFAALLAWLILGEKPTVSAFIAIGFVLLGMVLVVGQGGQESYWLGNICALISAIAIATTFVLNRKNKQINMLPAMSLSGLISAIVVIPFVVWEQPSFNAIIILLLMGLIVTIAFALITIAAKYIPAAEVSLVMPLETVGGTALAWWLLNEQPSAQVLLGAAIILLTLTLHGFSVLRAKT